MEAGTVASMRASREGKPVTATMASISAGVAELWRGSKLLKAREVGRRG